MQVVLFEILNDNSVSGNLFVNRKIDGNPRLIIYLKDKDEKFYLYENLLPEVFRDIDISNYPETGIGKYLNGLDKALE